jgi:uncharacterized paraquat-inducible protein A
MNCPKCGAKISIKKYLSVGTQGFSCSDCKVGLVADQSNTMITYAAYLAALLFLKYSFELGLAGILFFLVVITCFDFMFVAKVKITG